jgi:hypothetical protein
MRNLVQCIFAPTMIAQDLAQDRGVERYNGDRRTRLRDGSWQYNDAGDIATQLIVQLDRRALHVGFGPPDSAVSINESRGL